jgi:integrase
MAVKRDKHGRWGYDLYLYDPLTGKKSRRVRCFEFTEKSDAEADEALLKVHSHNLKLGLVAAARAKKTLSELVSARLADGAGTREKAVLNRWLEMVGDKDVEQIGTPDIKRYVDRRSVQVADSTVKREVGFISALLHGSGNYFAELSQWKVPKIYRPKVVEGGRQNVVPREVLARMLAYLTRPQAPNEPNVCYRGRTRVASQLRFLASTGCRPKEMFKLRWDDIDWQHGQVRILKSKNGKTRWVPMTRTVREVLEQRRQAGESARYVFSRNGKSRHADYDYVNEAREKLGVEFEMYDLRHTKASELIAAGMPLTEVAALLGHSVEILSEHYSHLLADSRRRMVEKLEELDGLSPLE